MEGAALPLRQSSRVKEFFLHPAFTSSAATSGTTHILSQQPILSYHQTRLFTSMDSVDYTKPYARLNLPGDVTLQELDERYFEVVEYWTVKDKAGAGEAKSQLSLVDEAYYAVLQNLIQQEMEVPASPDPIPPYTMQQVVTGQERMTRPSIHDSDMWMPPRETHAASPELDDDEDIEAELKYGRLSLSGDLGTTPGFRIREIDGDINDAPDRAVIVRTLTQDQAQAAANNGLADAVNCQGVWGYGIAKKLKKMVWSCFDNCLTRLTTSSAPQHSKSTN
jgi:hypothetical protein